MKEVKTVILKSIWQHQAPVASRIDYIEIIDNGEIIKLKPQTYFDVDEEQVKNMNKNIFYILKNFLLDGRKFNKENPHSRNKSHGIYYIKNDFLIQIIYEDEFCYDLNLIDYI